MERDNNCREAVITFKEEDLRTLSEVLTWVMIHADEDYEPDDRADWICLRDKITEALIRKDEENKHLTSISCIERDVIEAMAPLDYCLSRQLLTEMDAADVRRCLDKLNDIRRFLDHLLN